MTGPDYDLAVIGAGLMGSATAWAATRRGRSVALLEQYDVGHTRGSSHGSARIVRRGYGDPLHVDMTGEAFELWRELEVESGARLLRMLGGIDHGPGRNPAAIAAVLRERGVQHELLDDREAEKRWPGLHFEGPVLFHEQAGTVDAAAAVHTFQSRARAQGADVYDGREVLSIELLHPGVRVHTAEGDVTARRVVVSAGAWITDLVGSLVPLPEFTVTQQQVFHFPRAGLAADAPVIVHKDTLDTYSLPGGRDGGPDDARKIAEHNGGGVTTALARDGVVDPRARDRITDYVRRWLPGLEPTPFAETTCLYTSTANEDFVLDREGDIVLCSPCSGHGAKFAPLVGIIAAELAEGVPVRDERFTVAAHRSFSRT